MARVEHDDVIDLINEPQLPPWEPLLIKVAPTGLAISRKQSPHLPMTPKEITRETIDSYKAGAGAVHLHMRDEDGKPTNDPKIFRRVLDEIKAQCPDIIFDIPAILGETEEEKLAPLDIPEVETSPLQPGPMIVGKILVARPRPADVQFAAKYMQERGVKPELAVHDLSHLACADMLLIKPGLLEEPLYYNVVLHLPGSTYGTPANLVNLVERLPQGAKWMLSVAGRPSLDMYTLAIIMGGHVRIGLEDMVYLYGRSDELAKSNAQCVEKIVEIAEAVGRPIAKPNEARKVLGFKKPRT